MIDCVMLCLLLYFFFFKQKTAYEMRISDWSSDVCSSDLVDDQHHRGGRGGDHLDRTAAADFDEAADGLRRGGDQPGIVAGEDGTVIGDETATCLDHPEGKIGFAESRRAAQQHGGAGDRKSTRLNSSHSCASRITTYTENNKK